MSIQVDLPAYFERIGYTGSADATLETLSALHALHPAAIPFENLSPFVGAEVPLDLASVQRKLVHEQRGGYCFEHNLLFMEVLRALGFHASGLAARVVWNHPPDAVTPRGHMLLRVEVGREQYLADVGFGGLTLTAPLRLEEDTVQPTPHEPFRLVGAGGGVLAMQGRVGTEWRSLYRFDMAPAYAVDYELANYFLSRNPRSRFRTGLLIARAVPGRRYTLGDRRFTVHVTGANSEHQTLTSPGEIRHVLEQTFGIRLPGGPELDEALARLF